MYFAWSKGAKAWQNHTKKEKNQSMLKCLDKHPQHLEN